MHSRFVLKSSGNQYTFKLKTAGNQEIILTSERYTHKSSALEGIAAVRACADSEDRYRRRRSRSGQSYFVLRGYNGKIVGTSAMYSSRSARDAGIAAVRTHAPRARVQDLTQHEAMLTA